jgi:acyl-CoA synthetase (AMP-forming)/AMP-acid ligase II
MPALPPLVRPLAVNADKPVALRDGGRALTWDEVEALSARAAGAMVRDVSTKGRVAVFARNAVEPVLAYLSALRAGVSSTPVNFHLTVEECAYILTDASVEVLLVGPETLAVGLAAARQAGVAVVVGWRCPVTPGLVAWEDWLGEAAATGQRPARPYLHYTSGTTGKPKGAETPPAMFPQVDTVDALFAAYRKQAEALPAGPSLIVGPLYHTGPLNSVRHLAGGKPVVIAERFDAEGLLDAVARHRVSTVTLVPTHFQRLLDLPPAVRDRYDVSSLGAVSHTGAACPREVKRAMIDWFGPVLVESYGATECGSTNMITTAEWLSHPGSVGRVQPGFELVVIGETGDALGIGEIGQLYFRDLSGRGVVFHNDPEKTRAAHISPGVFSLGDVGYVDAGGYVFITDRVSDMVVSGGVNIYPAEVEAALSSHPDVADVAVIGVPNLEMGEAVKALIVPRSGARPDTASLQAHCRQKLAGYKCPQSFDLVDDIGRNAMGKVNKRALRAPFWPGDRTIGG